MTPRIRPAGPADIGTLDAGLRALSVALGHDHRAGIAELTEAGFGREPAFVGLLAEVRAEPTSTEAGAEGVAEAGAELAGVALISPLFSTTRGAAGVYVSDLWVAADWRGRRLGVRLLAASRDEGARRWGARFLRLGVGAQNAAARGFYARLGFTATTDETMMTLTGARLAALEGET